MVVAAYQRLVQKFLFGSMGSLSLGHVVVTTRVPYQAACYTFRGRPCSRRVNAPSFLTLDTNTSHVTPALKSKKIHILLFLLSRELKDKLQLFFLVCRARPRKWCKHRSSGSLYWRPKLKPGTRTFCLRY